MRIIIVILTLILCSCQFEKGAENTSTPMALASSLGTTTTGDTAFETSISWQGDNATTITRNATGSSNNLAVLDPITLPAVIPDSIKIDLPTNSDLTTVGVVNLVSVGEKGVGAPFSLGSNYTNNSGLSAAIGGLRSFFKDGEFQSANMMIQAIGSGHMNLVLRTPPHGVTVTINPPDVNHNPILQAPNRVLTQLKELIIQNNESGPVDVNIPGTIQGTVRQQIMNYGMGAAPPACGSNSQASSDASVVDHSSAYIFVKDSSLAFDWVSRSQAASLVVTLMPGESKTLGLFVDSGTAYGFYQNGVSYGSYPTVGGKANCQTGPGQDMNSPPECYCDDATFRTGTWADRPSFTPDDQNFQLRWGDLPAARDPETRTMQWSNGFGIF